MADVTPRAVIEETLEEIDARLREGAPGAAMREVRVRHDGLSRVVRRWVHVPPHSAQVSAMLECVLELRAQLLRVYGSASAKERSSA